MKTKNILTFILTAIIFSSCSVSLQQRRVADELYQNPESQPHKEQVYAGYYEEAKNILLDDESQNDSVMYEKKEYENPYNSILVDDYDEAYQRRLNASQSLSYGMSDWYSTYNSDAFMYASAYDPSFYNVIVMGDEVWVEPNWLTSHFGTGWDYGSFYNYPYHGQSLMNPYSSTLSMTGIYGFNSMGYGAYGYNAFGYNRLGHSPFAYNPHGFSSYGYSSYAYSPFGYSSYGYSPFGYSSFGYGSYYGGYSYLGGNLDYYNSSAFQQRIQKEYKVDETGRLEKYSSHSQRVRKHNNEGVKKTNNNYIRVANTSKANNSATTHTDRVRRTDQGQGDATSKYVRTQNENTSNIRPRYNRPKNEANYEKLRQERSSRSNISSGGNERKQSSSYINRGSSTSGARSSGSTKSSGSSSTRSSSGSSHSGRARK